MDVNPACFWEVVDYLNECNIEYNDGNLGNPHVGKEYKIVLQQLLFLFGLGDESLVDF